MSPREKTFPEIVDDYIREKQATGSRFDKAARVLARITDIQNEIDHGLPRLSASLLQRWAGKTPWENDTNRSHRISVLRGLSVYMSRLGYEAVAVPARFVPLKDYAYTPYIFSEAELGLLLSTADRLCVKGISGRSNLVFPLVLRFLIGCGLRITETLNIQKNDVDLETGSVVLLHTKNGKQRIVPMAPSLVLRCRQYRADSHGTRGFAAAPWFLPNKDGRPYSSGTLYCFFRQVLRVAGISHGGRGKGPRLHDLRHTFAVRLLNKWVQEGKNLTTALPYLAIYMGHEGLKASEHYLRLTARMFPDLVKAVEKKYGWVIPEGYHE